MVGGARQKLWVLVASAAVLCFLGSKRVALFDTDEPRYAQTAREMLQRGDFIVPTFNGEPRYAKPVLFYWFIIGAYRLFGVNEFSARFWSAVAALGVATSLFVAFVRPFGIETALMVVLCWLTAFGTQLFAHAAITDMLLTSFIAVTILAFWYGLLTGKKGPWFLGGAAMGFSVLTKGPVGFILPVLIITFAALWARPLFRSPKGLRDRAFGIAGAFAIATLIAAPWYIAITVRTKGAFLYHFLLTENITRYTTTPNPLPLWAHGLYYPIVLWILAFPWAPVGVIELFKTGRDKEGWRKLLTVWTLIPLILFTLSQTKNPQYVLPSVTALTASAGFWFAGRGKEGRGRWFFTLSGLLAASLLALVPFAINGIPEWRLRLTLTEPVDLGWGFWGIVMLLSLFPFLSFLNRPSLLQGIALMMIGVNALTFLSLAPTVSAYRQEPLKHFALQVSRQMGPDDLLVVYRRDGSSVIFYSNRKVLQIHDPYRLADLTQSDRRVDVFAPARFLPELVRLAPLFLVERRYGLVWLSNRPVRCPQHPDR